MLTSLQRFLCLKIAAFLKTNKGVRFDYRLSSAKTIIHGKCHTSIETRLLPNALEAYVNEIDNTQEKAEKSCRKYWKRLFTKFYFSLITFCTCLVW